MKCPNPSCGVEDRKNPQKDGEWQCNICEHWQNLYYEECQRCGAPEEPSKFSYYWDEGQLWFKCIECATSFRPSKTLNGNKPNL